jgi:hypothetical protein
MKKLLILPLIILIHISNAARAQDVDANKLIEDEFD